MNREEMERRLSSTGILGKLKLESMYDIELKIFEI